MADVFIAYAREDTGKAAHIAQGLAALGVDAFWDKEIPPGQTWADYLEGKLAVCKAVIVLWSEHSTKSQWVREEARMGREKSKLIPVLLDAAQPPFGFGEVQAADLSRWSGDFAQPEWARFAQAVQAAVGAAPGASPQPAGAGWQAQPAPQPAAAWSNPGASSAAAQLSPFGYIRKCLRLYADGKGRARRAEFGWFYLFAFCVGFVAAILDTMLFGIDPYTGVANTYVLTLIAGVALIAPTIAAASRRAHDFGQSGWLAALGVIPYLGGLVLLAFVFIPGQPGPNQHGPDPKAAQSV